MKVLHRSVLVFLAALIVACGGGEPEPSAGAGDSTMPAPSPQVEASSDSQGTADRFDSEELPPDARLDPEFRGPAYGSDAAASAAFESAYKAGDLNALQDVWWRLNARQRFAAFESHQRITLAASEEMQSAMKLAATDPERFESVMAEFEARGNAGMLLLMENPGLLRESANREARGLSPLESTSIELPEVDDDFEPRDFNAEYMAREDLGNVRGRVVDQDTREPVAGVNVAVVFMDVGAVGVTDCSICRWSAISADDGSFELTGIAAGTATINAEKLPAYNFATQPVEVVANQTAEQDVTLPKFARVQLELPTMVAGIVTDALTGAPVANVNVSVGQNRGATTQANGRFMIEKVDPGELTVTANHPDYHELQFALTADQPGVTRKDFAIQPITTGTVAGVAVDKATGEPLANATIVIAGQSLTTDAEGRFRIEEIESGEITVSGSGAGYRAATSSVALAARSTAETVLELDPITEGTVTGTVTDATSGDVLADVAIKIGDFDTVTDGAGRFEVRDVPAGTVSIVAEKPVFETGLETVDVIAADSVDVAVALIPITYGTLRVRVVDAGTGAALAGSTVRIAGTEAATTNEEGVVVYEKHPAGVGLASAELRAYVSGEESFELEPATELLAVVRLEPVTVGVIQGQVVSSTSREPIPGAQVSLGERETTADAEGRFELADVSAGTVTLLAAKPVFEAGSEAVEVIAAETVTAVIELDPITYGTVTGVVVDAETSDVIAGATVALTGQNTKTDAAGRFTLERVTAGDILLSASERRYETREENMKLAPAETLETRLALDPITYGRLFGRVVDADTGAPLADAEVRVGSNLATSGADGSFEFEQIAAGALNVSATLTAYEAGSASLTLARAGSAEAVLELMPIKIGTVVGVVLDAKTKEPIAGARAAADGQSLETDAAGRFRFEEVAAGPVNVGVRHADYGDGAASGRLPGAGTLELTIELDLRREDVTSLESALASDGTIDLYGILFDSGNDQFKSSSLGTLNALLQVMKRSPEQRYIIAGHTDSDGTDASNQDLSERRSKTVIDWLVTRGIAAERLRSAGYGESRPAAPNETESGKALNRRVELTLTP